MKNLRWFCNFFVMDNLTIHGPCQLNCSRVNMSHVSGKEKKTLLGLQHFSVMDNLTQYTLCVMCLN